MPVIEAAKLVSELNREFYGKTKNAEWQPFQLKWNGTTYAIYFLGCPVFNSGTDTICKEVGQTLKDPVMCSARTMLEQLAKGFDENSANNVD